MKVPERQISETNTRKAYSLCTSPDFRWVRISSLAAVELQMEAPSSITPNSFGVIEEKGRRDKQARKKHTTMASIIAYPSVHWITMRITWVTELQGVAREGR